MKTEVINSNSQIHCVIQLNDEECKSWYKSRSEICKSIYSKSVELMKIYGSSIVYRGVHFNYLDNIVRTGIDVTPSDSPIFTAYDPCKSIEYGWDDTNKKMVLLMLKNDCIKKSYTFIASDTPESEIKELQKIYPNREHLVDESRIYLSKLALDDPRGNGPYEFQYEGYIPGNPLEALITVFYIGNISDEEVHEIKSKISSKV